MKIIKNFQSYGLFLVVILLTELSLDVSAGPYLGYECTKASDCNPGECCVIGMMRYSIPSCMPYGQEGDFCFESGQRKNVTLSYPNGDVLDLIDVHTLFCPCESHLGFTCHKGTCHNPTDSDMLNFV